MAKSNQNFQGSNLRVLSIAYAAGRLDRRTYLKLRTAQLGALEFGKPLPALPEELHDITIPQIKIDASYINARKRRKSGVWLIVVALLVLGAIGAGLWYTLNQPAPVPVKAGQLSAEDYARRLLQSTEWSEHDITAFSRQWAALSAAAKNRARKTGWYLALDNETIKRINHLKRQLDGSDDTSVAQYRFELLRRFQAQLAAN